MDFPLLDFHVLVHIGYALMLCALIARDILWLRGILVCAQSILSVYAYLIDVPSIAGWNALFVVINTAWVIRILKERRAVQLPADLKPIHARHFAALSPPEFLRLWELGERVKLPDSQLVREGTKPEALYFLLGGDVAIRHGAHDVVHLPAGSFIAEMSLLTGELATADAWACGEIEVMRWPSERLRQVRARNPGLWSKIQSALGHDLVEKIRRASEHRDAQAAAPSPA